MGLDLTQILPPQRVKDIISSFDITEKWRSIAWTLQDRVELLGLRDVHYKGLMLWGMVIWAQKT